MGMAGKGGSKDNQPAQAPVAAPEPPPEAPARDSAAIDAARRAPSAQQQEDALTALTDQTEQDLANTKKTLVGL